MREKILCEFTKEVLGPRTGPEETLNSSPLIEYITGVLAPINADVEREAEDQNLLGETKVIEEEEASDYVASYPRFSPTVNPLKQPSSIGMSFMLKTREKADAQISICATWGRYILLSKNVWKRKPCYMVMKNLRLKTPFHERITPSTTITNSQDTKVSCRVYARDINKSTILVSVFLCNEEEIVSSTKDWRAHRAEWYFFQPQVRINCEDGTELRRFADQIKPLYEDNEDDQVLRFLYRSVPTMARGHMCAAVWTKVDPESKSEDEEDEKIRPESPPFVWMDGKAAPSDIRDSFRSPHLRTEFLPIHSVAMPELNWDSRYGPSPNLDASKLSECWNAEELAQNLLPLVTGYDRWIKERKQGIDKVSVEMKELANQNIRKHMVAIGRIRNAIEVLVKDDNARLAFCFLNKAMDLQERWNKEARGSVGLGKEGLLWRPFQLAFILLNIPAIVNADSKERSLCDLLWVPTGTGKTEAYLGLATFVIAYRRRNTVQNTPGTNTDGSGTAVLSRYTLRLLTIQQFRRTLNLITACEYLRVQGLGSEPAGWRPRECKNKESFLWGKQRFSIGLWVGNEMTPNNLLGKNVWNRRTRSPERIPGAIDILQGRYGLGEPAQIINCPCCKSLVSIPDRLEKGQYSVHLVFSSKEQILNLDKTAFLDDTVVHILEAALTSLRSKSGRFFYTISFKLKLDVPVDSAKFDAWWMGCVESPLRKHVRNGIQLESARPSRPGYFLKSIKERGEECQYDFDVFCTNPSCDLNKHKWCEGNPSGLRDPNLDQLSGQNLWSPIVEAFRDSDSQCISTRIPIPAYTVDDQVYHRCPTIVVATVDKFARLPFEPKSASLFGNVNRHHRYFGYYRNMIPPTDCDSISGYPKKPLQDPRPTNPEYIVQVDAMRPPDLIIQDELHLIEGPLGSLVGIYETAIDVLSKTRSIPVKYVASTATIRKASEQVQSVFCRNLFVFPPPGLEAHDSFFLRYRAFHALNDRVAGRLYVGLTAPGKGAQTPITRIWALLLQYVHYVFSTKTAKLGEIDPYWTIVGYFNAIRELAGATALYKQDVIGRLRDLRNSKRYGESRTLTEYIELSSRISSTALPTYLDTLEKKDLTRNESSEVPTAVFTTNIFGVGVDIPRLGLMVVHGQPKTTSSYIQATGRIGRRKETPGLVITFYRDTRPRDLSHYEYFVGYHSMLHRYVEPITVYPFAPRVRDRARGPVTVALLRLARKIESTPVNVAWGVEQRLAGRNYCSNAIHMKSHRYDAEVDVIAGVLKARAEKQPPNRVPRLDELEEKVKSGLDDWHNTSTTNPDLIYWERRAPGTPLSCAVVLGDSPSPKDSLRSVFKNVPSSLRDIEETIGFEVP
jgi:hypothetical protein